jgi:hypothetical protein
VVWWSWPTSRPHANIAPIGADDDNGGVRRRDASDDIAAVDDDGPQLGDEDGNPGRGRHGTTPAR